MSNQLTAEGHYKLTAWLQKNRKRFWDEQLQRYERASDGLLYTDGMIAKIASEGVTFGGGDILNGVGFSVTVSNMRTSRKIAYGPLYKKPTIKATGRSDDLLIDLAQLLQRHGMKVVKL